MNRSAAIKFHDLKTHIENAQKSMSSSAGASVIMQNGEIIWEWYSGSFSHRPGAKKIDVNSQFNIASCRKTYIAFAIAFALFHAKIHSIDDDVNEYVSNFTGTKGVKIRHLLTHCHGLIEQEGKMMQIFPPGTDWKYNNAGVNLLIEIVENTTGKTVSEILQENAFDLLGFSKTGWKVKKEKNLVFNVHEDTDVLGPHDSSKGDQSNLFTSAREFAYWGNLHLNQGNHNGQQLLSASLFKQLTSLQSPTLMPRHLPSQGFLWWVQNGSPCSKSEIGSSVPKGSFQILGYTGCACLVIPAYNAVAVRMLNQTGQNQHPEFNYLEEIRQFGDCVTELFAD